MSNQYSPNGFPLYIEVGYQASSTPRKVVQMAVRPTKRSEEIVRQFFLQGIARLEQAEADLQRKYPKLLTA